MRVEIEEAKKNPSLSPKIFPKLGGKLGRQCLPERNGNPHFLGDGNTVISNDEFPIGNLTGQAGRALFNNQAHPPLGLRGTERAGRVNRMSLYFSPFLLFPSLLLQRLSFRVALDDGYVAAAALLEVTARAAPP
jgi:hypothetical protein